MGIKKQKWKFKKKNKIKKCEKRNWKNYIEKQDWKNKNVKVKRKTNCEEHDSWLSFNKLYEKQNENLK